MTSFFGLHARGVATCLFTALLLTSGHQALSAPSNETTGNFMRSICNDKATELGCTAFVMGVVQGVSWQAAMTKTEALFCQPNEVTFGQSTDIFKQYLEKYPEIRHLSAASIVVLAIAEKFPCRK